MRGSVKRTGGKRGVLAAVLGAWAFSTATAGAAAEKAGPGLTEFAGERIPAAIRVVDDRGRTFRLAELIDRPTLLVLVYYTCEHVCPLVLGALGGLAADPALAIGRDYRIVTLSFDTADTPADAATARVNYTKPLGRELPDGAWTFLTAAAEDIAMLTEVLGFRYARGSHGFVHPSVLVVLGPGGTISSYIHVSRTSYGVGYPVAFAPGATAAALRLAAAGASGPRDPAPLLFCYPGEPPAQSRFYGLMSSMGAGTLILLAGLFVYLSFAWKRPRPGAGGP